MLIFVPEFTAANKEGDEGKSSYHNDRSQSRKEPKQEKDTSDKLGSFSEVDFRHPTDTLEHIPFQVALHDLRLKDFLSMIDEEDSRNDP